MSRHAKFQLRQEEKERINLGLPVRIRTFGGNVGVVTARSLQYVNPDAWHDHLFEMVIDDKRAVFSASELLQVLQAV